MAIKIIMLFSFLIITFGIIGFFVSAYIYSSKIKGGILVCFIGQNCNSVVRSRFSSLIGISNEIIGMIYYASIAASYAVLLIIPVLQVSYIILALRIIAFGAACFSLYLVLIQLFILKQWCEWCIASAVLSLVICFCAFFL